MDAIKDEATRFTWLFGIIIAAALIVTVAATLPQYTHAPLEKECAPFIYPICARAVDPEPLAPAGLIPIYLSITGTAILALILLYASYHASVIRQADLIAPTVTPQAPAKSAPSTDTADVDPPMAKPAKGVDVKTLVS